MFDIGIGLPINLVLFLCTLYLLNRLLFRPLQAVLDERERRSGGTVHESEKTLDQHRELFERYSHSLKQAQMEAYKLQDLARQEMVRNRAAQIAGARTTAESTVAEMKENIRRQVAEAQDQLRRDAEDLSGRITAMIPQKSA